MQCHDFEVSSAGIPIVNLIPSDWLFSMASVANLTTDLAVAGSTRGIMSTRLALKSPCLDDQVGHSQRRLCDGQGLDLALNVVY